MQTIEELKAEIAELEDILQPVVPEPGIRISDLEKRATAFLTRKLEEKKAELVNRQTSQ